MVPKFKIRLGSLLELLYLLIGRPVCLRAAAKHECSIGCVEAKMQGRQTLLTSNRKRTSFRGWLDCSSRGQRMAWLAVNGDMNTNSQTEYVQLGRIARALPLARHVQ